MHDYLAYQSVGQEFVDFCTVVDSNSRGKVRGRDLTILLSLLGVYANAEKIVLAHAPALKRAQRGDVIAAIAAKDAQAAAAAAKDANAEAKALRDNATPKNHPKAATRPDLRGDMICRDGKWLIFCKACKKEYSYAGWSGHCSTHHAPKDDDGDVPVDDDDDKNGNDGSQRKERPMQPKAKAATQKTVCKGKGKSPAAKTKAKK